MCIRTCTYICWCGTIIALTLCLEHRRAVERLIEERRAQFQAEKEAELEERKEEERREADRRAIIEQERQRLLQEHASKLLGYLPKVSHSLLLEMLVYTCILKEFIGLKRSAGINSRLCY